MYHDTFSRIILFFLSMFVLMISMAIVMMMAFVFFLTMPVFDEGTGTAKNNDAIIQYSYKLFWKLISNWQGKGTWVLQFITIRFVEHKPPYECPMHLFQI